MRFKELEKNWDEFGKTDPMWSILSHPDKQNNRWKPEEFYQTGEIEIDAIFRKFASQKIKISKKNALDFGCGMGRLTRALAKRFDRVVGVDVAPSMIELAIKNNPGCHFLLNEKDDLALFKNGEFDFIYSSITLQHMEPVYAKKYLAEFVRILKPGGIAYFQLVSCPVGLNSIRAPLLRIMPKPLMDWLRGIKYHKPIMEIHWVSRLDVENVLVKAGGKIKDCEEITNKNNSWRNAYYIVEKLDIEKNRGN
jgi:ubiquinone/menaquinone biosynthesis C-methylase UbiE